MTLTIRKSMFLPATPDTVWDHLTKADLLGKWFHPAEQDLTEGQPYILKSAKDGDRMCWGTVEKTSPVSHMQWSFTVGPLNGHMTTVDWHLAPAPGGTNLTLEHSGLPENGAAYGLVLALDKGWHGFLGNLHEIDQHHLSLETA